MNTSQEDVVPSLANRRRIMESCLKPAMVVLQRALMSVRVDQADAVPLLIESINRVAQTGAIWQFLDGHIAEMGDHCHNLANLLHDCYNTIGDDQLLIQAINLDRESLHLHPPGHPHRASSCISLADSLSHQYRDVKDDQLLTEMIALDREALSLCPLGHPEHEYSRKTLAHALEMRYERNNDDQLIIEAIGLRRELLSLCSLAHPGRAKLCTDLAQSLGARFQRTGNSQLLTEAIDYNREALSLCPPGHSDRRFSCRNLALSLEKCYEKSGDDELIIEATNLRREALSLCPPEHPDRAKWCIYLTHSLKQFYFKTGDSRLLTESIENARESLSLSPLGHPDRETSCTELALSLGDHYRATGNDQSLTEAIDLQREVLTLCPSGHEGRARACLNMSLSLKTRYGSTGDEQLLVESIELERELLPICPQGHKHHLFSRISLSTSLKMLHRSNGDDRLLIEAIDIERASLALCPPGITDRVICCTNLASSLKTRYRSTWDSQLLIEVIRLQREAMSIWPRNHTQRAMAITNLADSLKLYYEETGDQQLLDEIHALCEEGLRLERSAGRMWRLFSILVWLYTQPETAFFNASTAIQFFSRGLEHDSDIASEAISTHMKNLDSIWDVANKLNTSHHVAMATVYQRMTENLPLLINPVLDVQSQLRALRLCSQIGSDAYVNAILAEEHSLGLEQLEVAQGLVWAQRVHHRDPQLDELPAGLAAELKLLLRSMMVPGTVAETPTKNNETLTSRDVQHNRVTSLYALLQQIRAVPGLGRFMLGEAYSALQSTASTHPVVVLVGARGYFYALLLTAKEQSCSLISLNLTEIDLSHSDLLDHALRSQRGAQSCNGEMIETIDERGITVKRPDRTTAINHRMRYLWVNIVKPVLEKLGVQPSASHTRPRLHWCLTGAFTSLPIHAAGIYDGPADLRVCCADYVVSSYTPTITTLLRAQRASRPLSRESRNVALIAEKQANEPHFEIIHQVDAEVNAIAAVAGSSRVQKCLRLSGDTTVSGTCETMQDANIIHLACHGIQNGNDALQSGFCLGDGRLTISKLMELNLDNAFLAFLSACETAKGDKNQPDQVMHLAAAMMFTGFKTVIATMWAIRDEDGPMVAKWFYEELFNKEVIDGDVVAYSLDTAVGKLRESGMSLDRWAPFIQMGV